MESFIGKNRFLKAIFTGMISSTTLASLLGAQDLEDLEQNQKDDYITREVVITASGFEQDIRDASANISIVAAEQLQKEQINNLGDAVKHIQGISVTGSNSNETDISIRGLPGQYTLILIDGKRVSTRDSRPNGSGGFEAGFMPPISAIERIEVVQGPMSSLYGSDAVGGVINIITKKADNEWHGTLSLDSTLQEKSKYGNRNKGSAYLSGALVPDRLFMSIYGKHDQKDEDKFKTGSFGNKNWDIGTKLNYKITDNQNLNFDIGRDYQKRSYSKDKTSTTLNQQTKKYVDGTTINTRDHYSLSYDAYWDFVMSDLSFYQEKAKRKTSTEGIYSDREPTITNSIFDAKFIFDLKDQTLSVGGQYQHNKLKDDSVTSSQDGWAVSSTEINTVRQQALFIEDEIHVLDNLFATLGVRMDHHSEYGTHYNPRAYLVYNLNDNWTVKGGVAKAYRTPSIREISPNYGMSTAKGAAVMYGNPDLNPETAITEELSLMYQNDNSTNSSLTVFNTDFKNKIASENTGQKDPKTGLQLYKYYNIGKARIQGVETSLSFQILENLKATTNYTYMHSKRKSNDGSYASSGKSLKGDPLTQTPKHMFYAKLDYQATSKFNSYVQTAYTGKQIWSDIRNGYGQGARYQSSYTIVDFGASYQIAKDISVNGSINNLFNKQLQPSINGKGDWLSVDGRSLWVGINVGF